MSAFQSLAVLVTIFVIAAILFVFGLHLLFRFVMKPRSSPPASHPSTNSDASQSEAFRRQLLQLFHLHDSGLDQASIDALPVFLYGHIVGLKEPFDCAVCLCVFSQTDKLRLLPLCCHAFHIDCIDSWLLSNSTCPLCRGSVLSAGAALETPVLGLGGFRLEEEEGFAVDGGPDGAPSAGKATVGEIGSAQGEIPVRLGKFRGSAAAAAEGETSGVNLDARRCFSMGSFQYVVTDLKLNLKIDVCRNGTDAPAAGSSAVYSENSSGDGEVEGKKVDSRGKGESFSVSKIWQWSRKGKLPSSGDARFSAVDVGSGLPGRS